MVAPHRSVERLYAGADLGESAASFGGGGVRLERRLARRPIRGSPNADGCEDDPTRQRRDFATVRVCAVGQQIRLLAVRRKDDD